MAGTDNGEENFYTVDIGEFEGPLDLLLSLVRKNKINIYDIPVSEISEQYNRHLNLIEKRSLDTVGRYLPLLAELGLIKSRMLLPQTAEEETEEGADPRMELARRLVVYERFRNAAAEMAGMTMLGRDVFTRGSGYGEEFGEYEVETETVASGIWDLINALCEMRARINSEDARDIVFEISPESIERRLADIHEKIKREKVIEDFGELFDEEKPSKNQVVISFLAILELARKEIVELFQKKPFSSIKLLYSEGKKDDGKPQDKKNH